MLQKMLQVGSWGGSSSRTEQLLNNSFAYSDANSSDSASKAFDNNSSTYWLSNGSYSWTTAYVGYEFPEPVCITKCVVCPRTNYLKNFVIEGSDTKDGTYTIIGTEQTASSDATSIEFTIDNTEYYKCIRLRPTSGSYHTNVNNIQIYEIKLYGYNE